MVRIPISLAIFQYRQFVWLWGSQSIGSFSDEVRRMTTLLWVYEVSGESGIAIALLMFAETGPYALLGPLTGILVDRWEKRKILILSDIARLLLSCILILAILNHSLFGVYVVVCLWGVFTILTDLASMTLVPRIVHCQDLERGNALWNVGQQVSLIIGPISGAILFTTYGAAVGISTGAVGLAGSIALLTVGLRRFPSLKDSDGDETNQTAKVVTSLLQPLKKGLGFLIRERLIRNFFMANGLQSLTVGINGTVMVFFISQNLGRNPADLAWLSTTNGLFQFMIGSYLAILAKNARLPKVLTLGAGAMVIGSLIVAFSWTLPTLLLGVILTSLGNAPFNIGKDTLEQRYIPNSILGQIRGTIDTSTTILFLAATGLSGALVVSIGPRSLLVLSALVSIGVFIVVLIGIFPSLNEVHEQSSSSYSDDTKTPKV
jgi:DHA3 family macrolide efflux protein-like MFS transporter